MVNANSDVAVEIDGAGDNPSPTASVGEMPVSAGASARSKRAKQEVGKSAELAGLGAGQDNISATYGAAKPRPRLVDTKSNKTDLVLKRLRLSKGAIIAMLMETTGWQAHSVRGFLSAVVRRKLSLTLVARSARMGPAGIGSITAQGARNHHAGKDRYCDGGRSLWRPLSC